MQEAMHCPRHTETKLMPSKFDVGLAPPKSSAGTCACRRPDKCESAAGPCSSVCRRAWSGHSARAPAPAVRALIEDGLALVRRAQLPRVVLHEGVLAFGALLVHLARLAPRQPPAPRLPRHKGTPPARSTGGRTHRGARPALLLQLLQHLLLPAQLLDQRVQVEAPPVLLRGSDVSAAGGGQASAAAQAAARGRTMMSVRLTIFTSCSSASRSHTAESRRRF